MTQLRVIFLNRIRDLRRNCGSWRSPGVWLRNHFLHWDFDLTVTENFPDRMLLLRLLNLVRKLSSISDDLDLLSFTRPSAFSFPSEISLSFSAILLAACLLAISSELALLLTDSSPWTHHSYNKAKCRLDAVDTFNTLFDLIAS